MYSVESIIKYMYSAVATGYLYNRERGTKVELYRRNDAKLSTFSHCFTFLCTALITHLVDHNLHSVQYLFTCR
jgi:hypothetical protein